MKPLFTRDGILALFVFNNTSLKDHLSQVLASMPLKSILQIKRNAGESTGPQLILVTATHQEPIGSGGRIDVTPWVHWLLDNQRIIQISESTNGRWRIEGLSECEGTLLQEHVAQKLNSF
jgi:hypothetical protein